MTKVYIVIEIKDSGCGSGGGYEQNHTVYLNEHLATRLAEYLNGKSESDVFYIVEEHEVVE